MEKTLSQEERIRRAEEIYNRRRMEYEKNFSKRYINYSPKSKRSLKERIIRKMLLQVFICLAIYIGLYAASNSSYFFSDQVREKLNYFLSYDMNFNNMYNTISELYKSFEDKISNIKNNEEENQKDDETQEENAENSENDLEEGSEENDEVAVGGADVKEEEDNRTPEEIEIDYIKENYGIIWPLEGVITSRYGTRTPTEIVTANHYGIDIAGNIGTDIVAAMDGTVTNVSEVGDYGKHLQIEEGDVSTLYAHCSKICVSNGDVVSKGDKIAEVGQTRKSYRTALAF